MFGFGNSDDEFRKKSSRSVDEDDYCEDFEDEDEEEEPDEREGDDTRNYGKQVNPEHIQVISKKYIDDDDEEDVAMRISIIKDVQAGKEYIIFDSENGGLVVKER